MSQFHCLENEGFVLVILKLSILLEINKFSRDYEGNGIRLPPIIKSYCSFKKRKRTRGRRGRKEIIGRK